jgi:ribosome-associated toxin RatA of RatAB toxin-antitoxin module
MPKIDVLDEAVIDSPPMVVYNALLNEIAGVTHTFMPYYEFKLRGDMPVREGAIFDVTVNPKSRINAKFSAKVTKIVEAKSIEEEYAGDFIGTGKWTFEPTDGKTKVQFRVNIRTNRLLFSLVSPFVDFGKSHSDVTQKGLKALNSYLSKK